MAVVQLVVGLGDIVKVHVNDPNGKIGNGARLTIGFLADNGRYGFATQTGHAGSAFDYALTIPKGRISRLVFDSALQVSDAQGNPVATGIAGPALNGPADVTVSVR